MRSAQQVLGHFQVSEHTGLSVQAVAANREKYGENSRTRTHLRKDTVN